MKQFLVQIKVYGYSTIEADSWDAAQKQAEDMSSKDFDMSNDSDIDVLDEVDDCGSPVED